MIDELREYHFTPEAWQTYWALFQDVCLPIRRDDYGVLLGLWHEQVGDTVYFRHLWRYDSLDARAHLRGELLTLDAWRNGFLPQAAAQVSRQCLQVLKPRSVIDLQRLAPARYLHLYRCPTGKAPALMDQLDEVAGRDRHSLCGVWATEFSDPNQVVVMTAQPAAPALDLHAGIAIQTHRLKPLGVAPPPVTCGLYAV